MAIYKRENSKFYLYDFTLDGQRFRGSTKTAKIGEAKEIESAMMVACRERGLTPERAKRIPTLREFSDRFFEWADKSRRLSEQTRKYYRMGWFWLAKQNIANIRMDRISTEDADIISVDGSNSLHNCALRTLRRMLNIAVAWNIIVKAPRLHLLIEKKRTQLVNAEIEEKIATHLAKKTRFSSLSLGMYLILDAGMRPQEIVQMRIEDIDIEHGLIHIPKSKTEAGVRYVPMTARLKEILFPVTAKRESGWVFPSRMDPAQHIKRQALTASWRLLRIAAGLPADVKLYCARHQFATDAMTATKNPFLVMKLLGHTELRTTERYQHHDVAGVGDLMNARNELRHSSRHSNPVVN